MNKKNTSTWIWIISFVFMAVIAIYQRSTGPTYPQKVKVDFAGQQIKAKLLTSSDSDGEALVKIKAPDTAITGEYQFKRYKSHDEWTSRPLQRDGEYLVAALPHQEPAGKVLYNISLIYQGKTQELNKQAVILRFKGKVPAGILIPHVILMFLAMVFSTKAGLSALLKQGRYFQISLWTSMLLLGGGLIFGPIVQYYAFGAFWTGWPWGHDLTDNKTAVAMIAWVIAVVQTRKYPDKRTWVIIAAAILLAIFLVPHSVLGSEIDYTIS